MELLQDFNVLGGVNVASYTTAAAQINMVPAPPTTALGPFVPKSYHYATNAHLPFFNSKRQPHHRHLTEIDWNYEIEREKDNRDRLFFNEKVVQVKAMSNI
jgi:hypothetical protein